MRSSLDRLPWIILAKLTRRRRAPDTLFHLPEFIAGEQDVPEPLPQKQGLCQVGGDAVF
jgi:hypothetical protein